MAFVTAAPDASLDREELRAWVNRQVGKTQRLAAVVVRDALPRSTIGKVLKRELRDEAAAAIGEEAPAGV
ncbi:hypothetical protein [Phenylobacterium sp. J426]|uniref:AMP-binding enzyme n=1 Tax=Phenylobacterium sp. J426 TaxID=2898439 RepID=UPI0027E2DA36|nr:hypothetical protein [Phenylobacterium sp. J426]